MKNAYLVLLLGSALAALPAMAACPNTLTLANFTWVGAPTHVFTAALVNPKGTVSGDVDATGCDIGVYYGPAGTATTTAVSVANTDPTSPTSNSGANGTINGASVHGATYFGVVNNGQKVNITNSSFYDIGDVPMSGNQYGIGIYFAFQTNARGSIMSNTLWNYQLAGIVVSGPKENGDVSSNTVIGNGPTSVIIQTGIQIGYGATSNALSNIVVGNSYTGSADGAGTGILIIGGPCMAGPIQSGSNIDNNIGVGNDIGIWMVNLDQACNPVTTPTNNVAAQNTLRSNSVNNTEGGGYQAGITDEGDFDTIKGNSICGVGYTPIASPPPFLYNIDTTFTNNATVKNNTNCSTTTPVTNGVMATAAVTATRNTAIRPVKIQ